MAAKIPKNIRFRPDQVRALRRLETAETDFSSLVRIAVDQMLAQRLADRTTEEPAQPYGAGRTEVFHHELTPAELRKSRAKKKPRPVAAPKPAKHAQ